MGTFTMRFWPFLFFGAVYGVVSFRELHEHPSFWRSSSVFFGKGTFDGPFRGRRREVRVHNNFAARVRKLSKDR